MKFRLFTLAACAFVTTSLSAQSSYTPTKIFFTQGSATSSLDALKATNINGSDLTTLASDAANFMQPLGIAIDKVNGHIYVSDGYMSGHGILRFNMDGSGRTVIVPGTTNALYNGLALDAGSRKIYFTQGSGTSSLDALKMVDLNTLTVTTLAADVANFMQPHSVAIDKKNGHLYVTDANIYGQGIIRFNLDGSSRTVIVPPTSSAMYLGIVLDVPENKLYFAQGSATSSLDAIKSANLDGSGVTTIASDAGHFLQPQGLALDLVKKQLYVTDVYMNGQGILRYNIDGSGRTQMVASVSSTSYNAVALDEPLSTLPIHFSSFTATAVQVGISLQWTTESESGLQSLSLEKSVNGQSFSPIATFAARNSATSGTYRYTDRAVSGPAYYRVMALHEDGKKVYSYVINTKKPDGQSRLYVRSHSQGGSAPIIEMQEMPAGTYVIYLFNSGGQEIERTQINHPGGNSPHSLQIANQSKGIYHLVCIGNGLLQSAHLSIQ